jgi:hypothetical protein
VHEQSGFDRVLVVHSSASPDGFTVASQVLHATDRLGVLLAHRPGFVSHFLVQGYATTLNKELPCSGLRRLARPLTSTLSLRARGMSGWPVRRSHGPFHLTDFEFGLLL